MRAIAFCSIIPPNILRNIARNGDEAAQRDALLTLELAAECRGERMALSKLALRGVSPGEKRRTIYDAGQTRHLPGRRVRGEGDTPVRDAAANEAYDGGGKTYDFYRRVLNRNSIDDRGLRLDSTVHYGVRYSNALWNGEQMIYGDGDGRFFNRFTLSLDVIAHELTHGVTQYTAGLDYDGQSGALNEHFSDVFGVLVKQYSARQPASRADWLIGSKLFTRRVNGAAIRSMKAPGTAYDDPILGKDPQPDHMRNYVTEREDDGGVHVNSGIPNRAFYEVAILIGGKAWEGAGRIWYQALTRHLRRDASFQDCADATWRSAGELYGTASAQQLAVLSGWRAVGIDVSAAIADDGTRLHVREERYRPPAAAGEVPAAIPALLRDRE